jgi:hypothetical protein
VVLFPDLFAVLTLVGKQGCQLLIARRRDIHVSPGYVSPASGCRC